jgi:hypothetical protein
LAKKMVPPNHFKNYLISRKKIHYQQNNSQKKLIFFAIICRFVAKLLAFGKYQKIKLLLPKQVGAPTVPSAVLLVPTEFDDS